MVHIAGYVTVEEGHERSDQEEHRGLARRVPKLGLALTGVVLVAVPMLFMCNVRAFFGSGEHCGADAHAADVSQTAEKYSLIGTGMAPVTGVTGVAGVTGVTGVAGAVHHVHHYVTAPVSPVTAPISTVHTVHTVQVPAPAPEPVHTVVRRHYGTVYRKVPVNHYVHVQMPEKAPIVHTMQIQTPAKSYNCDGMGSHPDPSWSSQHTRWCCYKYKMFCPVSVVDKDYYHTVTKVQQVRVPVPEPMPAHAPIIHNVQHTYHVPSPPQYVHVEVPGPTVVKPVVVNENVPVPVPEPPQVINVKRPYPVHVQGPDHYVKVPVPSPPHVVTHYHTQWNTIVDPQYDCQNGVENFQQLWSHSKQTWCCSHFNSGCGHWEKVVHVYHSYDCHAGFSNWYHGWSSNKKDWCCSHEQKGCPGTWHGHWHAHMQVHVQHGVGHGGYDCNAGASNWIQGWSSKKKDWCCSNGHSQYCVKFHCHGDHGNVAAWSGDQRDFCCQNFQLGCPHTTLSPLGCDAQCNLHGETSTCKQRIEWSQQNVFSGKGNACNLAYSKVQVECDVCRACTIQAAGCGEQGPGKEAFDCNAALGNWCRAWSPSKKVWCCNNQQKGCQSPDTPPNCDAGAGKVWKKVMISGHWSWESQMAGAATSVAKPYACHAGLAGWEHGWSGAKKSWCCSHEQLGCPGYVYHGPGAHGHTHVVVTHHFVAGAGAAGAAAGAAGAMSGHSWSSGGSHSWSSGASYHHHHVVHHVVH
ncbi:unnamed protein product [Durusdinium trenchii]|uniref:Uncharacterized protein n=1 Tax=Durusdinium trenchii TaxID=1381693 RepID=A0ABP0LBV3_9DINO